MRKLLILFIIITISGCAKVYNMKLFKIYPPQEKTCLDKAKSIKQCQKKIKLN